MLMGERTEPSREIVSRNLKRIPGLVSGIDFCVDDVGFGERDSYKIVHVGWEASKTCFVAHEAMNEDEH